VSPIGKEGEKGGAPQGGKSALRRKETEEDGRRKGGASCKGRSAARMEEELDKRAKKEGRGALWKRRPKRSAIIRVRVDDRRDSSVVLNLQVRRKGVSCRRQPGARSDPLLEVERIELVWMQGEESGKRRAYREEKRSKDRESSAAQRGKSAAERRTVRRTGKRSKRGG